MEAISCKLCGTVIAERMERPIGYEIGRSGQTVKVVAREFVRFPIYTEIKIAFDDGSYHVTHGCSNCIVSALPPAVLAELHQADQEESPDGYTEREKARYPVGIVFLKIGGGPA